MHIHFKSISTQKNDGDSNFMTPKTMISWSNSNVMRWFTSRIKRGHNLSTILLWQFLINILF